MSGKNHTSVLKPDQLTKGELMPRTFPVKADSPIGSANQTGASVHGQQYQPVKFPWYYGKGPAIIVGLLAFIVVLMIALLFSINSGSTVDQNLQLQRQHEITMRTLDIEETRIQAHQTIATTEAQSYGGAWASIGEGIMWILIVMVVLFMIAGLLKA